MKPLHFLLVLGALLVVLFGVQRPAPQLDVFAAISPGQSVRFADMTEAEIYAAKLAHGRAAARHAVGLFGNSRAVMVSGADMGMESGAFFNFAVPGSSFRTSVALAEDLARAGKLPKTVLISLDHLEIQFDGNPNTRGLGPWLGRIRRDLSIGLVRSDIGLRDTLRAVWRHIYVGYGGLTRYFNAEQLASGVQWQFGEAGPRGWWHGVPRTEPTGYRRDGSRALGNPTQLRNFAPLPRAAPGILVGYMREDLRRLAALKRSGVRIIVYESPLAGASLDRAIQQPAPHVAAQRAVLLRDCKRLGLECYGQAATAALARADGWYDATHPPAKGLGGFLATLIARGPVAGAARPQQAAPAR